MTTIADGTTTATAPAALWTWDFSLYFAARVVSLLGDAMMPVAAALAVGALYGVSGVGYVLAVWTAPFVLFIVFGGVFSDRIGARAMMVGADAVRTVTQIVLAVAFFTGAPPLWLLLVASAISGAAAAMFQPGVNGMVPLVAKDPQRANGTLKIADAVTQLGGPVLAGLLMVATGAGTVYAVDAATFLLSGLCLALIRHAAPFEGRQPSTVLRDLRRGWMEFRSRTWMWSVILIWVCFGLFVFGPYIPLASQVIGERLGEAAYGWTMAGLGTGTVIGGLVAIQIRPSRPLAGGAVALVGFAAIPLSVALEPPLPVLIAGHIVGGSAWAFWSVMWSTSVQTLVPPAVLNRVTAYEVAGSVSGIAVGQALVGPTSAIVAPRDLLLVSTVVTGAVVAALLLIRPIRNLRRATTP
ncbi:MFS transporter [Micromonospora chaiyaphumensis]|uniref:Predicted arabinose efflux permease, MFS family n=1 Tax=Micromonospora chaiyaphumensis TaxID=307119 RepID=A0A1C4WCX7_9ACTN|nr:MFS transporter [Micromonospora chaiyaphumensis]SCE94065.1 Predicted arabinose efflux permease, MFS family [Micromonospora chaiyaphumensis]